MRIQNLDNIADRLIALRGNVRRLAPVAHGAVWAAVLDEINKLADDVERIGGRRQR